MKKIKKLVAGVTLASIAILNIPLVNAEWKHTNERLKHGFPMLMSKEARNATKDKQLCKIATSFDILDKDGKLKYTYYPNGCQAEENTDLDFIPSEENSNGFEEPDFKGGDFLDGLFSDGNIKDENLDFNSAEEFPEEGFNSAEEFPDEGFNPDELLNPEEGFNSAEEFSDEGFNPDELLNPEEGFNSDEEFLDEGFNPEEGLNPEEGFNSAEEFPDEGFNPEEGLNSDEFMEDFFGLEFKNNFKISSIEDDFSKSASKVKNTLFIYQNSKSKIKKYILRKKLITDLSNLKKKYKKLKLKDFMISKTLEKRQKV